MIIVGVVATFFVVLCIAFVMYRINTFKNANLVKIGENGQIVSKTPVVISKNLAGGEMNTIFWATMYRYDPYSKKIYFVLNRSEGILKEMPGADPVTFKPLAGEDGDTLSYGMDKNGIYCNDALQPVIDPVTFRVLNVSGHRDATYAKDKNYVYFYCQPYPKADPTTFNVAVNSGTLYYAKDKKYVYVNGVILEDAAPNTFHVLDGSYSFDARHLYSGEKFVGGVGYQFDKTSNGKIISKSYEWDQNPGSKRPDERMVIFEEKDRANILDKIKTSSYEGSTSLVVVGQKIYFVNPNGQLSVFNIQKNSVQNIPLGDLALTDGNGAPQIMDYFVTDNIIYFLYGKNCNTYKSRCDLSILSYDLNSGTVKKILKNISARDILGYDKNKRELYLRYSEGGAGCFWGTIYVLNLGTLAIPKNDYSACEGDPNYDELSNKLNQQGDAITDGRVWASGIYVEGGLIVPPPIGEKPSGFNASYLNL